jgi:5-oxoprolinase (ATP-hydrolysing)
MPKLPIPKDDPAIISSTTTGETIRVIKKPDMAVVSKQLDLLKEKGIKSVAVAFVHSYLWGDHELAVSKMAQDKGFDVSISSKLQPMVCYRCRLSIPLLTSTQIKLVARANSSIADAYLTPVTKRYIESFGSGFEGGLSAFGSKLLFMQSDGGLCKWDDFSGLRSILSGPAGGVVGFSKTCYDGQHPDGAPLIAVDMGGTSTDVSVSQFSDTMRAEWMLMRAVAIRGQARTCVRDNHRRRCVIQFTSHNGNLIMAHDSHHPGAAARYQHSRRRRG